MLHFFAHYPSSYYCTSARKVLINLFYFLTESSSQKCHCNQLLIKFTRVNILFQKHLDVYKITILITQFKAYHVWSTDCCLETCKTREWKMLIAVQIAQIPYTLYYLDCKVQHLHCHPHSG